MSYRLTQLFIITCSFVHFAQSTFILNVTDPGKILCYSCKGDNCEQISRSNGHILACNKHTQLCWAGFVDQKPYRTCANRYCTPSVISLDSDVRNELCCRSNLCNTVALNWSASYDEPLKSSNATSRAPATSQTTTVKQLTMKNSTQEPQIYLVDEMLNESKPPSHNQDNSEEHKNPVLPHRFNAKEIDPLQFDINWERVSYNKDFGTRMVSMSKLVILLLPLLLVLLF